MGGNPPSHPHMRPRILHPTRDLYFNDAFRPTKPRNSHLGRDQSRTELKYFKCSFCKVAPALKGTFISKETCFSAQTQRSNSSREYSGRRWKPVPVDAFRSFVSLHRCWELLPHGSGEVITGFLEGSDWMSHLSSTGLHSTGPQPGTDRASSYERSPAQTFLLFPAGL